jgi:hypothetical protein
MIFVNYKGLQVGSGDPILLATERRTRSSESWESPSPVESLLAVSWSHGHSLSPKHLNIRALTTHDKRILLALSTKSI